MESGMRRKAPVPFGKGPTEKDLHQGHLAGGLLHFTGGNWKRSHDRLGSQRRTTLWETIRISGCVTYCRSKPPRQFPTLLHLADSQRMLRDLDGWLRRRLRQVRWKEWKTTAAKRHNLRIRGISERNARKWAGTSKGYWRVAGSKVLQVSLPNTYWNRLGLLTLTQAKQRLNPTA